MNVTLHTMSSGPACTTGHSTPPKREPLLCKKLTWFKAGVSALKLEPINVIDEPFTHNVESMGQSPSAPMTVIGGGAMVKYVLVGMVIALPLQSVTFGTHAPLFPATEDTLINNCEDEILTMVPLGVDNEQPLLLRKGSLFVLTILWAQ